jgi:drug/metabolite transporter (DMT)-like permease
VRGRRAWLALAISLVGVVLAVGGIDPDDSPPLSGLLLAFASCFIYAVWVILAARLSGERGTRSALSPATAARARLPSP